LVNILRQSLFNELEFDTSNYSDIYFDLLEYDLIQYGINKFLLDGIKLLTEIKLANSRLRKFSDKSIAQALEIPWRHIKRQARLSLLTLRFEEFTPKILKQNIALVTHIYTGQKIIIYGTDARCMDIMDNINNGFFLEIIAFCDSNKNKHGTEFFGKQIIAPERLAEFDYDYICIASPMYEHEIKNQLTSEYHIPPEKIFNLSLHFADEVAFHKGVNFLS
jgi:FlaA1/EpsC-like NDP-sugar epimerase